MNLKKLREIFVYKVILSAAGTAFSLYTASAISKLISRAGDGVINDLLPPIIWLLAVYLCYFSLQGIFSYFVSKRESLLKQRLKFSLYRQFFALSPANLYLHRDEGEVLESFRDDFNTVTGMYSDVVPSMIMSALAYAAYLVYAGVHSLPICLLMLVLSQFQIVVPLIIEPKFYDNYADDREWEAKTTNVEIEAHTAFRDIRIFGLRKWYLEYLAKFQKGCANVGKKYEYLCGIGTSLETLVNSVIRYGTYAIIGVFVFLEYIPVESATLLLYLSAMVYSSLMEVYEKLTDFSENRMARERLLSVSTAHLPDPGKDLRFAEGLSASGCTVSAEGRKILDIPALMVQPDIVNIITGENGAGKSTLLKVLAGLILPDKGDMEAFGEPCGLFYLQQDDIRLHETALSLVDASKIQEYKRLCNRFALTDEILDRPLQTLSGGECKKVYLALAFLSNDSYLILDEPTNNLDFSAKEALAEMISERKRKIVLVTHDEDFLKLLTQRQEVCITHLSRKGEYSHGEEYCKTYYEP